MKDKEKQIEEIALEMSKELCCYYDKKKRKCTNCFGMEEDCDLHCNFARTLKRLSDAGYRKLPEDSVVLTKSQYDMLIALSSYEGSIEQLKNTVTLPKEVYEILLKVNKADLEEQASYTRKETVEKIYRSYEKEYGEFYDVGLMLLKIIIKEQFGIEF